MMVEDEMAKRVAGVSFPDIGGLADAVNKKIMEIEKDHGKVESVQLGVVPGLVDRTASTQATFSALIVYEHHEPIEGRHME